MKRLNLAWFVQFGSVLQPLVEHRTDKNPLQPYELIGPVRFLQLLLDEKQMPLAIKASRPIAQRLLDSITPILAIQDNEQSGKALNNASFTIWNNAYELTMLLNAELAVQPTFQVWPKRAYDTDKLVNEGDSIFSPTVRDNLTAEEKYDAQQAGRCLAFEVPTAAAFHVFRATESVLRRYYRSVTGTLPRAKMRNWGAYLKILEKKGADPKILFALGEVKDMYRNPVMHPETQVGIEEALSLLGLADTLIGGMIEAIRKKAIADIIAANPGGAVASLFGPTPDEARTD